MYLISSLVRFGTASTGQERFAAKVKTLSGWKCRSMSSAKHRHWDRGFGACRGRISTCCCAIKFDLTDFRNVKGTTQT